MLGRELTNDDIKWIHKNPQLIDPIFEHTYGFDYDVHKINQILPGYDIPEHSYTCMAYENNEMLFNAMMNWYAMNDSNFIVANNEPGIIGTMCGRCTGGYLTLYQFKHDRIIGRLCTSTGKSIDYKGLGLYSDDAVISEVHFVTSKGDMYVADVPFMFKGNEPNGPWCMSNKIYANVGISYMDDLYLRYVYLDKRLKQKKTSKHLWINIAGTEVRYDKIVATAWVPNPNGYKFVKHIDGDPWNFDASNLVWVETSREREDIDEDLPEGRVRSYRARTTATQSKPILLVDEKGNIETRFASITEACDVTGASRQTIRTSLTKDRYVAGKKFVYENQYDNYINSPLRVYKYSVYDANGNRRFSVKTLNEVAEQLGITWAQARYAYAYGKEIGKLRLIKEKL